MKNLNVTFAIIEDYTGLKNIIQVFNKTSVKPALKEGYTAKLNGAKISEENDLIRSYCIVKGWNKSVNELLQLAPKYHDKLIDEFYQDKIINAKEYV